MSRNESGRPGGSRRAYETPILRRVRLVPDEAVNLPLNCPLELHIRPVSTASAASESPNGSGTALRRLASLAKRLPTDPNAPTDGSQQHDHYLYRTAKR